MTPLASAIALLAVFTFGYAAICAASPFGNCRKCRGFGFRLTTDRRGRLKRGRHCRRCEGTGKRIRVGRWLYHRAVRVHRAVTR